MKESAYKIAVELIFYTRSVCVCEREKEIMPRKKEKRRKVITKTQ